MKKIVIVGAECHRFSNITNDSELKEQIVRFHFMV